jgi:hypothetical protein
MGKIPKIMSPLGYAMGFTATKQRPFDSRPIQNLRKNK